MRNENNTTDSQSKQEQRNTGYDPENEEKLYGRKSNINGEQDNSLIGEQRRDGKILRPVDYVKRQSCKKNHTMVTLLNMRLITI